ncbi:MAG: MBL fold metallo-hydrolase, partial [Planctomycetota bacterium]
IFLTHAHIGHYTGLAHLGKEVMSSREIPVWATPRMAAFLTENGPWSALVESRNVVLQDATRVDLGGVVVSAFPVPHRQEFSDTVGYRIEGPEKTVVFIPDIDRWEDWDRDIREVVEEVDYAFLDATFFSLDELPHRDIEKVRHPLVTETMDRLDGLGEKVFFLHLNHTNPLFDDPSPARERGFTVARQGDVLSL